MPFALPWLAGLFACVSWIDLPSLAGSTLVKAISGCADDPKEATAENLFNRSDDFEARRAKQIQTPNFPTTTIGSFPQTPGIARFPSSSLIARCQVLWPLLYTRRGKASSLACEY